MKKMDIVAIVFFILMALLLGVRNYSIDINMNEEKILVINVDGKNYGRYNLQAAQEIVIKSENGKNVVVIADGQAMMVESDCKDQVCVETKGISEIGQSIICLPHRVSVEIVGESGGEVDAISR